jgi:hypothetical protein
LRIKLTKPNRLSDSEVNRIAFAIIGGTATRRDAKRLLLHFCRLVEVGRPIPTVLLECLRVAFVKSMTGKASIDAGLGLRKRPGRPRGNESKQLELAIEVVKRRFSGSTYEDTIAQVSEAFYSSATKVKDAFRRFGQTAVWQFRQEHPGLTPAEIKRLAATLRKNTA